MNQSEQKSVTEWIADLKAGDAEAAQRLFERYFDNLVRLANKRLKGHRQRAADAEDVVQNVLASLMQGAPQGKYPKLTDRHDLWALLIAMTKHKAADQIKQENREKRGGGKVRGESIFGQEGRDGGGRPLGIIDVLGHDPTPADCAQYDEHLGRLFARLDKFDEAGKLRQVLGWRLQGLTIDEIAEKFDVVRETIERKLKRIRLVWIASAFEDAWQSDEPPLMEESLELVDGKRTRWDLFRMLLPIELKYRRKKGEPPTAAEYRKRFPEFADHIQSVFPDSH